jgi:hypothetical protein
VVVHRAGVPRSIRQLWCIAVNASHKGSEILLTVIFLRVLLMFSTNGCPDLAV